MLLCRTRAPECSWYVLPSRWGSLLVYYHSTEGEREFSFMWCVSVRASLHMRREEKPTRCHWMFYCTYNMLNMFRAPMSIIRSSRLYACYCRLWCAVPGCWLSGFRCRVAGYASRKRDVARLVQRVPLPLLTYSTSAWPSWLLYRRGRKSQRDLWVTLYSALLSCYACHQHH